MNSLIEDLYKANQAPLIDNQTKRRFRISAFVAAASLVFGLTVVGFNNLHHHAGRPHSNKASSAKTSPPALKK